MISNWWHIWPDDSQQPTAPLQGQMGSAHSLDGYSPDKDPVNALHEVVEEITGKPLAKPPRKLGFY